MSPEDFKRKSVRRKSAVAIHYDRQTMPAPKVVAKGKGVIAEKLIALARQHGVPIVENRLLVEALDELSLNQAIPADLYQVVAEILVAVYKADVAMEIK